MLKANTYISLLLIAIILSGCTSERSNTPAAVKGEIDLTQWDFQKNGHIALSGEWTFQAYPFTTGHNDLHTYISVPGNWNASTTYQNNSIHSAIYTLTIKLPKNRPSLSLKIDGVSTRYIFSINNQITGGVGANTPNGGHPQYAHKIFLLDTRDSIVQISLTVMNTHHYKGGILEPISLGIHHDMISESKSSSMIGGALLGLCLLSVIVYMLLYIKMRDEKYFLFYSLYSLTVFIHLLCLIDRTLYHLLGDTGWVWAYKIELSTIFIAIIFQLFFYHTFFSKTNMHKWHIVISAIYALTAFITFVLPAPYFTYIDAVIPIAFFILGIYLLVLFIRTLRGNAEGAIILSVLNVFILIAFVKENLVFNKVVHAVQSVHYVVMIYMIGISLVLINRIIKVFRSEKTLSHQITLANEKLEKQNKNLEEIVYKRTSQLIEAEKQTHQLQIEKKEKDLDTLAASNLVKLQFTKNLIDELESLPRIEKELKPALSTLISKLKAQASLEEKMEVLQKDMDRVNAEFYQRLNTKFPDLSKTERELCAYIKLNLSNKDIAELRKTTLNTINVTRSRLRKKLGLTRDEELENFIQQF